MTVLKHLIVKEMGQSYLQWLREVRQCEIDVERVRNGG